MPDALEQALTANRTAIESALDQARRELEEVRTRERELVRLIRRAEVTLDVLEPGIETTDAPSDLTLHEAMQRVLTASGHPMTARELADAINRQGLYQRRDGDPLDSGQVHARVHRYSKLFRSDRGQIDLRLEDGRTPPS
jgi:hypothetical protein